MIAKHKGVLTGWHRWTCYTRLRRGDGRLQMSEDFSPELAGEPNCGKMVRRSLSEGLRRAIDELKRELREQL